MSIDPEYIRKLARKKTNCLSPRCALYLAAMTVMAADGKIVNAETCDLSKIVRCGGEEDLELAYAIITNCPYEKVVDMVACSLNEEQQTALIAILLDLSMADGVLARAEETLITDYVVKFGIPLKTFRQLCHFTAMKNNFALFNC